MQIIFHIEYYAPLSQSIVIGFDDGTSIQMQRLADGEWRAECDVKQGAEYRYLLQSAEGELLREEDGWHKVDFHRAASLYDNWQDKALEQPFRSSFFKDCVFRRSDIVVSNACASQASEFDEATVLLQVEAPALSADEVVAVVGQSDKLGGWQVDDAVGMSVNEELVWSVSLPHEVLGTEYKFVVLDAATRRLKRYESGENRLLALDNHPCVVVRGLRLRDRLGWRGAGVAIPVFSLRSNRSWGCGDFGDLRLMADWAAATGMSVIQLLPVNDTTTDGSRRDSYPYNAISSFALHPLYLSPDDTVESCVSVVAADVAKQLKALMSRFARRGKRLNSKPAVDYEATMRLKREFLQEVYALCGESVIKSEGFARFFDESRSWLLPYMAYCALRDHYATVDFTRWESMSHYDTASVERYIQDNYSATYFYAFVQYLLDEQLRRVNDYAHSVGVALKGDIPIGVAPFSVDVWCAPELYNCEMSAGAPPDAFAEDGQNWGFPTYNWSRMAEDGYAWWCARLRKMERYFDAYRIDHILGFFRIWEVPRGAVSAVLGHFNPSLPYTEQEIESYGFEFDAKRDVSHDMHNTDTLFLEYPYSAGGYFPRIEGFRTDSFKSLSSSQQQAYMQLYEEFYYNRHNDMWRECALKRLRALGSASDMLTCGEDLGMIPSCVAEVMSSERILSLEIERMPKLFGQTFGDVDAYPYYSVAATSTHDMSTLRGWWEEDADLMQRYWSEVLHRPSVAEKSCSGDVARQILLRQMHSNSMLAILPLQDWLAVDEGLRLGDVAAERINIPADANHYWRYRMHLTLEELLSAEEFNTVVADLVVQRKS